MGPLWKLLLPLSLLLAAVGFITGAVLASGPGEPAPRRPLDLGVVAPSPTSSPAITPSSRPTRLPPDSEVPVVTPRPGSGERDGDDRDQRDARDEDDGREERDDERDDD